ncbi:MAG: metallophosphoesterase [Myxococcota bacterium]
MSRAPSIRYVCLSDTHFGEEDSLLTCLKDDEYACDPRHASPVLVSLVESLTHLLQPLEEQPTLVLNGDILELAFANYSQSLATFERFMELTVSPGREIFRKVVYLPGNHDHHVWEIARETQYVNTVLRNHHYEDGPPPPIHATPLEQDGSVVSFLLDPLMRHVRGVDDPRAFLDYPVFIAYPNLGFFSPQRDRAVVLHHGHFLESLYMMMSALRRKLFPDDPPVETVAQLEGENWAWIDFVWSLLGRSGDAGMRAEILYKRLQYPMNLRNFISDLAIRIAKTADLPMIPGDWLETKVLKLIFSKAASRLGGERLRVGDSGDAEIERGLERYLFNYTYRQLTDEYDHVPEDVAFVFGHTHKPFQRMVEDPRGHFVEVYNTGGWVVDNADREPTRGASIVLIGEDLEIVSLRVYHDGTDEPQVTVSTVGSRAEELRTWVEARVRDPEGPWARLVETITREAAIRRDHLHRLFVQ